MTSAISDTTSFIIRSETLSGPSAFLPPRFGRRNFLIPSTLKVIGSMRIVPVRPSLAIYDKSSCSNTSWNPALRVLLRLSTLSPEYVLSA